MTTRASRQPGRPRPGVRADLGPRDAEWVRGREPATACTHRPRSPQCPMRTRSRVTCDAVTPRSLSYVVRLPDRVDPTATARARLRPHRVQCALHAGLDVTRTAAAMLGAALAVRTSRIGRRVTLGEWCRLTRTTATRLAVQLLELGDRSANSLASSTRASSPAIRSSASASPNTTRSRC